MYDVWLLVDEGEDELIVTHYSPEFAACRVLQGRGVTGLVRFWRANGVKAWEVDIDIGAEWTVLETCKAGPRIVPFRAFDMETE